MIRNLGYLIIVHSRYMIYFQKLYIYHLISVIGRFQRTAGFQKNNMNNAADLQPQFDVYHRVENHTIQLGATAFLPCIIKNLGNRSVSFKFLFLINN